MESFNQTQEQIAQEIPFNQQLIQRNSKRSKSILGPIMKSIRYTQQVQGFISNKLFKRIKENLPQMQLRKINNNRRFTFLLLKLQGWMITIYQQQSPNLHDLNKKKENVEAIELNPSDPQETQPLNQDLRKIYFREDSDHSKSSLIILSGTQQQNNFVNFKLEVFVKYFLIFFLHQLLGPIISILFYLYSKKKRIFITNLGLWGCNKLHLIHLLFWAFTVSVIIITPYAKVEQNYGLAYFYVFLFTKSFSSAASYAYSNSARLKILENTLIPHDKSQNISNIHYELYHWIFQSEDIIAQEIENSIERLEIEKKLFEVYFIVPPSEAKLKNITSPFYEQQQEKHMHMVPGYGPFILKVLIENFKDKCLTKKILKTLLLIQLVRHAIVILLEFLVINYCFFAMKEWYLIYLDIVLKLFNCVLETALVMFFSTVLKDLQRKVFLMSQMANLISARKIDELDNKKLFPTMNTLCYLTLFSWINMRKICLDYGKTYTQRQTTLLSYIIFCLILVIILSLLTLFEYITIPFELTHLQKAFLGSNFIFYFIFIILIILQGARINSHFKIHQELVLKNKFIVNQIISTTIIEENFIQVQPDNYIYKTLFEQIQHSLDTGFITKDQYHVYGQIVMNQLQNTYEELCFDEKNRPYKVLGIAMTSSLAIQLLISCGTAALTIFLQIKYNLQL